MFCVSLTIDSGLLLQLDFGVDVGSNVFKMSLKLLRFAWPFVCLFHPSYSVNIKLLTFIYKAWDLIKNRHVPITGTYHPCFDMITYRPFTWNVCSERFLLGRGVWRVTTPAPPHFLFVFYQLPTKCANVRRILVRAGC